MWYTSAAFTTLMMSATRSRGVVVETIVAYHALNIHKWSSKCFWSSLYCTVHGERTHTQNTYTYTHIALCAWKTTCAHVHVCTHHTQKFIENLTTHNTAIHLALGLSLCIRFLSCFFLLPPHSNDPLGTLKQVQSSLPPRSLSWKRCLLYSRDTRPPWR